MEQSELKREILNFLREYPIMSIAVSLDNKPMASVVVFTVADDFTFHFVTQKNSYKAKALLKNPQISMAIWKINDTLVQADAVVNPVPEAQIDAYLSAIAASNEKLNDFWPPLVRISDDEYVVFEIKPTWLRVLDLKSNTIKALDTSYKEIKLTQNEKNTSS